MLGSWEVFGGLIAGAARDHNMCPCSACVADKRCLVACFRDWQGRAPIFASVFQRQDRGIFWPAPRRCAAQVRAVRFAARCTLPSSGAPCEPFSRPAHLLQLLLSTGPRLSPAPAHCARAGWATADGARKIRHAQGVAVARRARWAVCEAVARGHAFPDGGWLAVCSHPRGEHHARPEPRRQGGLPRE